MMIKVVFLSCFILMPLWADPWGKDADMAYQHKPTCPPTPIETPLFGQFGEMMIGFHQQVISPCDGPRSHFYPSSSQYTLDAMRRYGFFKGFMLGCDRLLRENNEDWVYQKEATGLKLNPVR